MEQERSSVLLVRVWTEGGTGEFRARLTVIDTSGAALAGEGVTVALAASGGDVLDAVRAWLDQFADPAA